MMMKTQRRTFYLIVRLHPINKPKERLEQFAFRHRWDLVNPNTALPFFDRMGLVDSGNKLCAGKPPPGHLQITFYLSQNKEGDGRSTNLHSRIVRRKADD